jgi:RNA polymerase sigma-70 factor (ECF subfamily)
MSEAMEPDSGPAGGAAFPQTRWTLILAARTDEAARRAALGQLAERYWRPIYFFLRRKGLAEEDAEDATQGLFLRLMEQDALAGLDPARGRLRGYLRTAADRYRLSLHERESAQKRGGGAQLVDLDLVAAEAALAAAPAQADLAFDREWALGVMERALAGLAAEYAAGRRAGQAETMLRFFGLGEAPPSYQAAAAAAGLTVPQLKAALHRARVRFRENLRAEIADTVDADADVDAELADLVAILAT